MIQIDSIMSTRTENENEASRRLKSEFLVQFDGVSSGSGDLVTVIGMCFQYWNTCVLSTKSIKLVELDCFWV